MNPRKGNKKPDPVIKSIPFKSLADLWSTIACTFALTSRKSLDTVLKNCTDDSTTQQFLARRLPILGKDLDRALLTNQLVLTPGNFAVKRNRPWPAFLGEFFSVIFDTDGWIKQDFDRHVLRQLRTLLYLIYKYEVAFTSEQEASARQKFIDVDSMVKEDFTEDQYSAIRKTVEECLPLNPWDIKPRHSGGATADKITNYEKRNSKRTWTELNSVFPQKDYFHNTTRHYVTNCYVNNASRLDFIPNPPARFTVVPKNSDGGRGISIEPCERMFPQKGLMHAIYTHIEKYSPHRGKINFTDQSLNRFLAYKGSMDGSYATIDLKDASDLVSWELVKNTVPTPWRIALEATRAKQVDVAGMTVDIKKFASMGSALCFPIEAMFFYAIVKTVCPRVWIYGDDIIVPNSYAADTMNALEAYGLVVNKSKSCFTGFFRESCGGDYYRGYNITPLRLKKSDYVSVVAFSNLVTEHFGLKSGEAAVEWFESFMPRPVLRLPFTYSFETAAVAFRCNKANKILFRRRFNKSLQKYEIRTITTIQRKNGQRGDDHDFLFDWFTNHCESDTPMLDAKEASLQLSLEPDIKPPHSTTVELQEFLDREYASNAGFQTATHRVGYRWCDYIS